jgi:ABC-2 type transport system permease protein
MIKRTIALIIKELLAIWRDKKSRISILIPPVIQLVLFTFSATLDVKNVPIGILNRDNGRQSFELLQRFRGAPVFSKIVYLSAIEEIAPFIDNQKGIMVISIDEQFSRLLESNKPAIVQLLFDGRKSNTAQIVAGYANNIIARFNADFAAVNRIPQQDTVLIQRNWFNPNILYHWYNVPCLVGLISMLTCLIVTSKAVARERELGTFDQLLVSPLIPIEILAGKLIPGMIIGMLEGSIILVVGILVFQVPFTGSFVLFYLSLLVFVCSISGVGLFISSLCSTQQQAILGVFLFMTPATLLSGFATPIENIPPWLQPITYLFPFRYMLVIAKGIFLKAMPLRIVINQIWPMLIIALFTQTAAALSFRRKMG